MTFLLISILCLSLEADSPKPPNKAPANTKAASRAALASETDPSADKAYDQLQAQDDAAQAEVDKWTAENVELAAKGAGMTEAELKRRVHDRFEPVRKAYDDFLRRHPNHVVAHLTYGSFLADRGDEAAAQLHWEKALELDPKNAVAYNNLGGAYTEQGLVKQAYDCFSKAIELSPSEASFYHNFGDSIYVLRRGMVSQYGLTEQQVYAKSLQQYSNAVRLDPKNYLFASDLAQTYYALTPLPFDDALKAWTNALAIASDQNKRELAHVHLARLKMLAGRIAEARAQLNNVTNQECFVLKSNLLLRIKEREKTEPPAVKKD